jgi:hypothetical protein
MLTMTTEIAPLFMYLVTQQLRAKELADGVRGCQRRKRW